MHMKYESLQADAATVEKLTKDHEKVVKWLDLLAAARKAKFENHKTILLSIALR